MLKEPLTPEDLESGAALLHSIRMVDSPELRWAFIRKVYSIVAFQLILTAIVSAVVISVNSIPDFIAGSWLGIAVYIVNVVVFLIVVVLLCMYSDRHPVNYFLLAIFTVSMSFLVGLTCALISDTNRIIILQAAILTASIVTGLTLYTFWAVRRGRDFTFLEPFLLACLIGLIAFVIIQICFPYHKVLVMICEVLGLLVFSAYILLDTARLSQQCRYDEYIFASISIYLDIILLLSFLNEAAQRR